MLNVIVSVGCLWTFVFVNLGDAKLVSSVLPNAANAPFLMFKTLMVYVNRKEIKEILLSLHGNFPLSKEKQTAINAHGHLKTITLLTRIYAGSMMFLFVAVIVYGFNFYIDFGTEKLPTDMWFPFSYADDKVYLAVCSWVNWISLNVELVALGGDLLLFALVTLVSMEFDLLRLDVENIGADGAATIESIVTRHQGTIDLCDKLEIIYASSFLYNVVQSSILICFVAFQLSSADGNSMFMVYAPYLFTAMIQIYLICYLGQKLIDASSGIATSVYNCKWYEPTNRRTSKSILMLLTRAQAPNCLTAKKFKIISLESFTTVSFSLHCMALFF